MASGAIVETFERGVPGGNPLDPSDRMIVGGPEFNGGVATASAASGLGYELDWELVTRSGER